MYNSLYALSRRPKPFSQLTAGELWTRPHLARQMLMYHLSQDTELASRPIAAIDQVVRWIDAQLELSGKRLCDLGCGPGLYTERFAALGAEVTGVDFSKHSLEYARAHSKHRVSYLEADYLSDMLPAEFEVVTLIYHDFCALSPDQRKTLLGRIRKMLSPGGWLVMDVAGIGAFDARQNSIELEYRLMGGFWSEGDYVGIHRTHIYAEEQLSLDHFLIVEPGETWQIYNWLQHYTPQKIETELNSAGFAIERMAGGLTGIRLSPNGGSIGIIAKKETAKAAGFNKSADGSS